MAPPSRSLQSTYLSACLSLTQPSLWGRYSRHFTNTGSLTGIEMLSPLVTIQCFKQLREVWTGVALAGSSVLVWEEVSWGEGVKRGRRGHLRCVLKHEDGLARDRRSWGEEGRNTSGRRTNVSKGWRHWKRRYTHKAASKLMV